MGKYCKFYFKKKNRKISRLVNQIFRVFRSYVTNSTSVMIVQPSVACLTSVLFTQVCRVFDEHIGMMNCSNIRNIWWYTVKFQSTVAVVLTSGTHRHASCYVIYLFCGWSKVSFWTIQHSLGPVPALVARPSWMSTPVPYCSSKTVTPCPNILLPE